MMMQIQFQWVESFRATAGWLKPKPCVCEVENTEFICFTTGF